MKSKWIGKTLTSLLAMMLLLPANIGVLAEESASEPPQEPAIAQLQPNSSWQASVFGDVGGQDKVTAANFSMVEDEQGSVHMKSMNDRGKISSTTDGIAYVYQSVPQDQDFEFSATATIHSIADNNQASFGVMLRNTVYNNVHGSDYAKDDYLAVGALDKKLKLFSRVNTEQAKRDLDEQLSAPAANNSYQLNVKKTSGLIVVTVNGYSYVVDDYVSDISYVGLFTARNADITYDNIELTVASNEPTVPELGELKFYAFGSNTSEEKNPEPMLQDPGAYTLEASGGKIASGDEGLSLLAYEVPAEASFTLQAIAKVEAFNSNTSISTPNQKSFGLMLRDTVGEGSATITSNYVAVGALDTVMKGFYKFGVEGGSGGTQTKLDAFSLANPPAADEQYELKIEKNQDSYTLSVNGESQVISAEQLFSEQLYAGVYVARDAQVTFSNIQLSIDTAAVHAIELNTTAMKTTYRLHEELDLTGLTVTAVMSDGSRSVLSEDEYLVTGFDSSELGNKHLTVHYKGQTALLAYEVVALQVTSLEIVYEPAVTSYYVGEELQLHGLTVEANYEDGYMYRELTPDLYSIIIEGQRYDGFGNNDKGDKHRFTTAGSYTVSVVATEGTDVATEFTVNVVDASLTSLEITQQPIKTTYFIGEELELDGLMVYGQYSDGTRKRIEKEALTISGFSSASAGEQQLVITYREQSVTLPLTVKEKEAVALVITKYPKTTYKLGESLDVAQLELAIAYDNGELEAITGNDYSLDSSRFNAEAAGEYKLMITSNNEQLPALELIVHVRDDAPVEWKSIRFGQSTSASNNTIEVDEQGVVTLKAIGGSAGKVTGDHDGISFYYVELDALEDNFELSADIKVIEYAKSPDHDGQESFGIMARDAIGAANDSSVFASNIAAVGGYSGGTRNPNGTQLFVRTGIESPDGSGSQGIQSVMLQADRPAPSNTYPAQSYRLTLAKTNSGFTAQLNDSEPVILYTPHILSVQDNKMYVGFYVARLATIEVHNIELNVTAVASDPPRVEPPAAPLEPAIAWISPLNTSTTEQYEIKLKSNTSGLVTIKQGNTIIASDVSIEANQVLTQATNIERGHNRFTISFNPSDSELLTSHETIILNRTVTAKQYEGDIYVAPDGSAEAAGTLEDPLDLDTAIQYVAPGQTIIVQDGHYVRDHRLNIQKYNDGTDAAMKTLKAADGARPVIDFNKKSEGVVLSGNYWHIIGIDFARSAGNTKGFTIGGSHNIVELSRFYEHGDTGLQISRTDDSTNIEDWPSYNLILNSDSFANRDPSDNNADGFAAKLTSGVGNVFRGAIAYNNVDDGWDLYTKAGSGAIGAVTIENSIAYNNGYPIGSSELKGDGNGFKLGGEGIHVQHVIRNSIAFNNGTVGFTSNSNPGVIARNNIGFNNAKGNIVFTTYPHITPDFTVDSFVSFATESIAKDQVPDAVRSLTNYLYDGARFANRAGTEITESNFKSLELPEHIARDEAGNIVLGDFLSFIAPITNNNPHTPSQPIIEPSPAPTTSIVMQGSVANGVVAGELTAAQAKAALDGLDQLSKRSITITLADQSAQVQKNYRLKLPAHLFDASIEAYNIELVTDAGSIVIPSQAFSGRTMGEQDTLLVSIRDIEEASNASPSANDERVNSAIAFELYWNDQPLDGLDLDSALQLFVPYEPAVENNNELSMLTIWHMAKGGTSTPIPNAYYDAKAKGMRWKANHLGEFAVGIGSKSFVDVPSTHWAYNAIRTLAAKGVINGVNESSFAPNETITRADFIVMLMRALGLTARTDQAAAFTDVDRDAYYYDAIVKAQQLGIVNGYPTGEFKPNQQIERQEMFVMAYKAIQRVEELRLSLAHDDAALARFTDASTVAGYAKEIIGALVEHGIIEGYSDKIAAQGITTRAEAAVFIERLVFLRY